MGRRELPTNTRLWQMGASVVIFAILSMVFPDTFWFVRLVCAGMNGAWLGRLLKKDRVWRSQVVVATCVLVFLFLESWHQQKLLSQLRSLNAFTIDELIFVDENGGVYLRTSDSCDINRFLRLLADAKNDHYRNTSPRFRKYDLLIVGANVEQHYRVRTRPGRPRALFVQKTTRYQFGSQVVVPQANVWLKSRSDESPGSK